MKFSSDPDKAWLNELKLWGTIIIGLIAAFALAAAFAYCSHNAKQAAVKELEAKLDDCTQTQVIIEDGVITGKIYDCSVKGEITK